MTGGWPIAPVLAVDLAGSAAMILLAVCALILARRLTRRDPGNVVWSFLWVLSLSLAAFSFSRGVGHIARILLVGAGRADAWQALAPLSGSINTATFMAIAGVTVFYGAVERAFLDLSATTDALRQTYTQLKDAYDALAADQARIVALERFALADRIAASLAHQTRNPIASIAGFAGILKRKCKGDQEVCANLEVISQEAAKLEQLVDGILKARHELASVFVETAPAAVAAALFEAVREKAALAGVRLWVRDSGVSGTINADVDGLVMALKEIVLNAVEVTPQGGEVIIGLTSEGGRVLLTVADRGSGIAPEVARRIFDPYFSTKKLASGLGLSFAKEIIETHNGYVNFVSRPGEGTTFTVSLPLVAPHGPDAGAPAAG